MVQVESLVVRNAADVPGLREAVVESEGGKKGIVAAVTSTTEKIRTLKTQTESYRRRMNTATASTPIIMLTGLSEEQDELKAFQEGVDDYIVKPFKIALLRARVAALLARTRAITSGKGDTPVSSESASERVCCGHSELDRVLDGGLPRGANILVIGETGSGKSSVCRCFLGEGL